MNDAEIEKGLEIIKEKASEITTTYSGPLYRVHDNQYPVNSSSLKGQRFLRPGAFGQFFSLDKKTCIEEVKGKDYPNFSEDNYSLNVMALNDELVLLDLTKLVDSGKISKGLLSLPSGTQNYEATRELCGLVSGTIFAGGKYDGIIFYSPLDKNNTQKNVVLYNQPSKDAYRALPWEDDI